MAMRKQFCAQVTLRFMRLVLFPYFSDGNPILTQVPFESSYIRRYGIPASVHFVRSSGAFVLNVLKSVLGFYLLVLTLKALSALSFACKVRYLYY